jgi:hypothetical protein
VGTVEHLAELVEITDPDHMSPAERRKARLAMEESKFDPEHYMCARLFHSFLLSDSIFQGRLCNGR